MIIKQLETKYGIKGKTAVHRQAWKEAYVGLANRSLRGKNDKSQSSEIYRGSFFLFRVPFQGLGSVPGFYL